MKEPEFEIDFKSFDNIFGNKPNIYLKFLDACISSFKKTLAGIKEAVLVNVDFDAVSELRHAILPTIASLSLNSTSELLKNLYPSNKNIAFVVDELEINMNIVIGILEKKKKEIENDN